LNVPTGRLDVRIPRTPLTVGDPLVVQLTGTLPHGATLLDHVAQPRDTLPDGVRLLAADTIQVRDGVIVGHVRVAFFRPDSEAIPPFAIAYRTPAGADTLVSQAVPVLIHPVLPTANATLRDIRDVEAPLPVLGPSLILLAGLLALLLLRLRGRRHTAPVAMAPAAPAPSAYDVALERLNAIDAALPVEQRYALVADVVRGYIAAARAVPALERTTPEILSALGANGALSAFLREADLVKFAGLRPDAMAASSYATRARGVLDDLR
jgi:hypothetical protein